MAVSSVATRQQLTGTAHPELEHRLKQREQEKQGHRHGERNLGVDNEGLYLGKVIRLTRYHCVGWINNIPARRRRCTTLDRIEEDVLLGERRS